MPAECPRCGADDADDFIKKKDVDYPLRGNWACKECGYTDGLDAMWSTPPYRE